MIHKDSMIPGVHEKVADLDMAIALAFQEGYEIEIDDLLEQRYELQKWIDWERAMAAERLRRKL